MLPQTNRGSGGVSGQQEEDPTVFGPGPSYTEGVGGLGGESGSNLLQSAIMAFCVCLHECGGKKNNSQHLI